jgi:3-oxoacyl-[acyl-carrier-protein] synthase-3
MRIDARVSVTSAAVWLPSGRSSVEDAVADGILQDSDAVPACSASVPTARGETPEEMAEKAARKALATAGRTGQEMDYLAYAWIDRDSKKGAPSPPHHLARRLDTGDCPALGVVQACNGGAAAVETAVTRMLAESRTRHALAVTADTFAPYGEQRWSDPSVLVLGDGATAAVLSAGPGPMDLLSLATSGHTCPRILEPGGIRSQDPTTQQLLEAVHSVEELRRNVHTAVRQAFDDAGLDAGDPRITSVLLPRLAQTFLDAHVRPGLPEPLRSRAMDPDPSTGHLGAGDTLANLAYLLRPGGVPPGGYAVVVNGGQGVTASCMVLRAARSAECR